MTLGIAEARTRFVVRRVAALPVNRKQRVT